MPLRLIHADGDGSGPMDVDRDYYTLSREEHLEHAQEAIDLLVLGGSGPRPDLDAGACDDCKRHAAARFTIGRFELCRDCRRRRLDVLDGLELEPRPARLDSADLVYLHQVDEALGQDAA